MHEVSKAEIRKIIITGASGFIGRALVEHFAAKGWHVIALVRRPKEQVALQGVTFAEYDLSIRPDERWWVGTDYLVHAANAKQQGRGVDAYSLNVSAADQLLAIGRSNGIKRAVFLSSMSARPDARSVYGRQKWAIERLFDRSEDTVLRSGLVIGNGGLVAQTARFIRSKRIAPLIDGGHQPLQIIGINDLTAATDTILAHDLGGTFTVASPEAYSYRHLYQAVADRIGVRVFFVPVPFVLPLALIRMADLLRLPLAATVDNLYGLRQLQVSDTAPDLERLGLHPEPLRTVLQQLDIEHR